MTDGIRAIFFLAAALLVVSGAAKLRRPEPASRALDAAGLPGAWPLVRGLGAGEVLIGAAALVVPGAGTGAALAAAYLGFALFLASLIVRRIPAATCGCAGRTEAPPTWLHVALDLSAAAGGVAVAVRGAPALHRFLAAQPLDGAPLVLGLAVAGYAAFVATAGLPEVRALVSASSRLGHRHAVGGPSGPPTFRVGPLAGREEDG